MVYRHRNINLHNKVKKIMHKETKRIVLVDPSCVMIDSLSTSAKIIIDTLIVSSDLDIAHIKKKYNVQKILSFESINNFYIQQNIDIDYEVIKAFRETELKVEHFLSRVTTDINSIQILYYSALFYWLNRFKSNSIDAVISSNVEFGSTFDSVIFDVAKYYQKKVYITEVALSNGVIRTNQLFDYTRKEYLPINLTKYGLEGINKSDFIFNSKAKGASKSKKNITKHDYGFFKNLIINGLSWLGGYLLLTFPLYVLGKHNSIHHTFRISWWTYFKNHIYTTKMKKYYNSLCSPFDPSQKYIYLPLHMEPEAATQNRTISSNQMIIIKTIAQNLPAGWILYVKEHPHQYANLNKLDRYYYLSTINKFRTKRYYDDIIKVSNVKFLCVETSSELVLKEAQATASINGTIILESIMNKKPVLAFSQDTTPFVKVDGVFDIRSSTMCQKYINKIKDGYIPNNDTLDQIIENYFYVIEDNEKNNFSLMVEDLLLM
jgi:uncharacterized pyridoxamine 5'-phosphate oxidase family protein